MLKLPNALPIYAGPLFFPLNSSKLSLTDSCIKGRSFLPLQSAAVLRNQGQSG